MQKISTYLRLVLFLPLSLFAATGDTGTYGDLSYEELESAVAITSCNENAVNIEIPAYIADKPVVRIDSSAFDNCTSLTSLMIPETISYISVYVFWDCSSLTKIDVHIDNPYLSSANGVIYDKAFKQILLCPQAYSGSEFIIPSSATHIGHYAFKDCLNLTNIILPDSITYIDDYAFNGCSGLTSLTIPESVTSITNYSFNGIPNLTNFEVDTDNLNYSSSEGVLYNKNFTQLIQYPQAKAASVYNIAETVIEISEWAFSHCLNLTNVTIPEGVTIIKYGTFNECVNLEEIRIPSGVTSIEGQSFNNCSKLTHITFPSGINSIGSVAFSGCNILNDISFNGNSPETIEASALPYAHDSLTIYYYSDRTGFDSEEWDGYTLVELEPYIWRDGKENTAGNVLSSDWYSWFYIDNYPLIYHPKHGYQYCYEDSADSLYLWDYATQKWFWTHKDFYPWIYIFNESPRYFYFSADGTAGNRWFNDPQTGQWVFETNI